MTERPNGSEKPKKEPFWSAEQTAQYRNIRAHNPEFANILFVARKIVEQEGVLPPAMVERAHNRLKYAGLDHEPRTPQPPTDSR